MDLTASFSFAKFSKLNLAPDWGIIVLTLGDSSYQETLGKESYKTVTFKL